MEIRFTSIEINNKKEDFKNEKDRFETLGEILKIVSDNKSKDGEDKNNEKLEEERIQIYFNSLRATSITRESE